MSIDRPIGMIPDQDYSTAMGMIGPYGARLLRSVGYAGIASLLTAASSYDIYHPKLVVMAIGLFGLFTGSARIGQIGLAVLMILATVPKDVLMSLLN